MQEKVRPNYAYARASPNTICHALFPTHKWLLSLLKTHHQEFEKLVIEADEAARKLSETEARINDGGNGTDGELTKVTREAKEAKKHAEEVAQKLKKIKLELSKHQNKEDEVAKARQRFEEALSRLVMP